MTLLFFALILLVLLQAVKGVFQSHASVQLQGSTTKGTALIGKSDWDFFVRLDDTIQTVTQKQRRQVWLTRFRCILVYHA